MEGHFEVQLSEKKFSLMGLDQSQEHSIRMLKEDSGSKGLYGQTEEKLIIELSKAEVLHTIEEFECASTHVTQTVNTEHPKSSAPEQQTLLEQRNFLLSLVNQGIIINPYEEAGYQLRILNTGEYVNPEVSKCLNELPSIGKAMYSEYVKEWIQDCIAPLSNVIPKANLYTFLHSPPVNLDKGSDKLVSYTASTTIVTQMFISLQARSDSDMDKFFRHENTREPPSLSNKGKLRTGTKSQILGCLHGMPAHGRNPTVKVVMPAVVHIIRPQKSIVFGEYTRM